MRKIFLIICLFFLQQLHAKENPVFDFIKVWNFLKYYHPDLASGKLDADSLFLNHIESKNLNINQSISLLTKGLTNIVNSTKKGNAPSDIVDDNQDFDWFERNPSITIKNKKLLRAIHRNRFIGEQHYYVPKDGFTIDIPHEKAYNFSKEENLPLKFRLLALAKIIGAIDYLYPHKYLMDGHSTETLKSLIDECLIADSRKAFETVLAKSVALLEDTHSYKFYYQFHHKKEIYHTSFFAPFDYQILDDYVLVTHIIIPEICEKANIAVGDRIKAINSQSISEIILEKSKLLSTSNRAGLLIRLSDYQQNLLWMDDDTIKNLTVQKAGHSDILQTKIALVNPTNKAELEIILSYLRGKIQLKNNRTLNHPDISYFRIDQTFYFIEDVEDNKIDSTMDSLFTNAASKKAIVFDMRAYPDWGGFIYTYVYKYFGQKSNYFGKYYQQNLSNIGTFSYVQNPETYFPANQKLKSHQYKGKVFILVNEETLSASEWNTMNLQHIFPQSITIGQQTAGADGDIKRLMLPGGYQLEFTGNAIFYPNNDQTQKKGLRIDQHIPYTDADFLIPEDRIFEIIKNQL
ncbi:MULTISPECIES: S41 family peptidase [Sphingobacterium]|uniref:S41 family peptidase n=1 Tax=Sphingobacterium tenebrionis TaxID=3111775 RepID=A0ABU8I4I2_9SPHI|nr:S41 family peptidase [Sphingobacterium sp. 1.A.4]